MTEKNYNPEQRHSKAQNAMSKMEKASKAIKTEANHSHQEYNHEHNHEHKHEAVAENKQAVNEERQETKTEAKKTEVKKPERKKKTETVVRGIGVPISSKTSFAISKFIKNKTIDRAIRELEEIIEHKRALPMKGEIPHRRGKGMMSGRYPENAVREFIKLLKSLNANAMANEMSNPFIYKAYGNFASRPFGRFGRVRKKRTHITIFAKNKETEAKK